MAKTKSDAELQACIDREYPTQTLYESPPEASKLREWVRDVEARRREPSAGLSVAHAADPKIAE